MNERDLKAPSTLATEALQRGEPAAAGCRLVVMEGDDAGAELDLPAGAAVVGKSSSCDLQLADSAVSGQHLRIEVSAEGLRVTDLESTNGTFYLGGQLAQAVLPIGAVLRLGRTRLALASRQPVSGAGFSERDHYGAIVGGAPAMRRLYAMLERLEKTEYTILVQGETGVGKELVAREVHLRSPRAKGPYEILDCASIPRELAESQLFGHVRGAFTGADRDHKGVFERARGGAVFLDEIGELSSDLQPKLLRVLENRQVHPVGGQGTIEVDARVIAATNRDLGDEVEAGRFREDLYFRLNVVTVVVPPLRDRREDIPALVRHFLQTMNLTEIEVSQETVELFTCGYDWPGNVRELRNAITRVASLGAMPEALQQAPPEAAAAALEVDTDAPFLEAKKRLVEAFEHDYLHSQMERSEGNIAKAARLSDMDRSYFKRLLKRHGLLPERI